MWNAVEIEETLSIREVVARTGVPAGTLRMWEARHGFPAPQRLATGHRRYSRADCDAIARVLAERERGVSLRAAIDNVRAAPEDVQPSLFAALRRARPGLASQVLAKRHLTALSRAIEDECFARAERARLFGAFQRVGFYRAAERRWSELARTAEVAVVFADFDRAHVPPRGVCEVPLPADAPLRREWAVVCDGERLSVALAAWELPAARALADPARRFETVWTVEPDAVRHAARAAATLAVHAEPRLADRFHERPAPAQPDLAGVMDLMGRCVAYVARAT